METDPLDRKFSQNDLAGKGVRGKYHLSANMPTQRQRAETFRTLHQRPGIFVMPNPWDAGSAKLFASLGFEAMATTSQGFANALGRVDGALAISRDEVIANCRVICEATGNPPVKMW